MKKTILLMTVLCFLFSLSLMAQEIQQSADKKKPVNEKKIQKKTGWVFKQHCATAGCHKGLYPKKKLNLEEDKFYEAVVNVPSQQIDSLMLVDTKRPERSYLLMKVKGEPGIIESKMPVDAPPLIDEEIAVIKNWIFSLKMKDVKKENSSVPEKKKPGKKKVKKK